jgi:hypothetical protein
METARRRRENKSKGKSEMPQAAQLQAREAGAVM